MQKVARSNVFVAQFAVTISGASAGEPPQLQGVPEHLCSVHDYAMRGCFPRQGRPIMRLRREVRLFTGGL